VNKLFLFCNRITPSNWHIIDDPFDFFFQGPGTLNIVVRLIDHFIDGWIYALKRGSMRFRPLSHYKDHYASAGRSFEKHGDYLVGESEIWLYPDGCRFFGDDLYAVMVHELAHVAVDRWLAFRLGICRASSPAQVPRSELGHGDVFCKAYENLILRVDGLKEDSGEIVSYMRSELKNYRCAYRQMASSGKGLKSGLKGT
jgi:hypothetical protein